MLAQKRSPGFTLIELMVVVAIVGILAAIAYPSYTAQVLKSRRADAKAVLMQAAQWMERFATVNNRYDQDTADPPVPVSDPTLFGASGLTAAPIEGTTKYYSISISAVSSTAFTLTATPIKVNQAQDGCIALTLTNTGAKGVADAGVEGNTYANTKTAEECWR